MNFFEQQDQARRKTTQLVLLFIVSVVLIVIAVNVAVYFIARNAAPEGAGDPRLMLGTTFITLLIIGVGTAYKTISLWGGGPSVAQLLGGRPLDSNSLSNAENTLRNVVEEMSIASGVPMPRIYVLDNEEGINAFAAGYTTADTVIGVTRGAIEKLNRDELQGVIGHEFSHILNGDMRLNLRLIGLLNGILVVSLVGYAMMRIFYYVPINNRRKSQDQSFMLGVVLLGALVYAIGSIGALFGRLIQSAVSRQREFLADASAVQFTRNPAGLVSALKKLGGYSSGSRVENPHSIETAHLFFGNSAGFSFGGLLATHPPLAERIRRLDPTFDGKFERAGESKLTEQYDGSRMSLAAEDVRPLAALSVSRSAGHIEPRQLQFAHGLLASIPSPLTAAAHEPFSARALVLAMLLSDESNIQRHQLNLAGMTLEPACIRQITLLHPIVESLADGAQLATFDVALPALRQLSPPQAEAFLKAVRAVVEADGKVTLFEYAIHRMLAKQLAGMQPTTRPTIQYFAINAVRDEAAVLLSALALVSSTQTDRAFELGSRQLSPDEPLSFVDNPGLAAIDSALQKLSQSSPAVKKRLIDAAAVAVAADGEINVREAELLRATAATLDIPLPPLLSPLPPGEG